MNGSKAALADSTVPRKKVAIVGSGCAGLATLWALNRSHHDVYLYEAAGRLGGHTNTAEWTNGPYKTAVDTGFIVMNTATYRQFALLETRPLGPLANQDQQILSTFSSESMCLQRAPR